EQVLCRGRRTNLRVRTAAAVQGGELLAADHENAAMLAGIGAVVHLQTGRRRRTGTRAVGGDAGCNRVVGHLLPAVAIEPAGLRIRRVDPGMTINLDAVASNVGMTLRQVSSPAASSAAPQVTGVDPSAVNNP